MVPLTLGQEVFLEARTAGGSLAPVGFSQLVRTTPREVVLALDAPSGDEGPRRGARDPGDPVRPSSLEPMQRVRMRLSDESGAYFADTRVVRVDAGELVLQVPSRVEVEWQRKYFRLDVRLPFTAQPLGLAGGPPMTGNTRDLSGGGFRTTQRLGVELGTRFSLTMHLPHAPTIVHTTRYSWRGSMQGIAIGSRSLERKSLRPAPEPDPPVDATLVQAEAVVVRCRMLWTSDEVSHDVGLHFTRIHERTRDRLIAFLLDEQRRRKAMGLETPRSVRPRAV